MKNILPAHIPYRKGDKWGFCNLKKAIVISVKYDEVGSFIEDVVRVKLNDKWGFIDTTGREITSIKYDWVEDFHNNSINYNIHSSTTMTINIITYGNFIS